MSEPAAPSGPDLVAGVPIESLQDGIPLLGHSLMAEAPDATLDALIGFLG